MFIAIDQYNQIYYIKKHPRKELVAKFGVKSAQKMYCDTKEGKTMHVGYIISGLWLSVFKLSNFKEVF